MSRSHCAGALHIHCVNKAARASVWKARGCLPLLLCGLMRWRRHRQGHDVNSWSITVKRGVSSSEAANWVWQSCFCGEAVGTLPGPLQEPGSACGCTCRGSDERYNAETGGRRQWHGLSSESQPMVCLMFQQRGENTQNKMKHGLTSRERYRIWRSWSEIFYYNRDICSVSDRILVLDKILGLVWF